MTETTLMSSEHENNNSSSRRTSSPPSSSLSSSSQSNGSSTIQQNGDLIEYRKKGKCKWFNVAKGWGFITPEDGSQEVFVHQSVIQMGGFRSLGDDEIVEFEFKESDKGIEATLVTGPNGIECKGSHRRPQSKKKVKKIRCYNCGDLSHHIASKCTLGPQPKRCHSCKSDTHLIADCPKRIDRNKNNKKMLNGNSSGTENGTLSPLESIGNSETANSSTTDEIHSSEESEALLSR